MVTMITAVGCCRYCRRSGHVLSIHTLRFLANDSGKGSMKNVTSACRTPSQSLNLPGRPSIIWILLQGLLQGSISVARSHVLSRLKKAIRTWFNDLQKVKGGSMMDFSMTLLLPLRQKKVLLFCLVVHIQA